MLDFDMEQHCTGCGACFSICPVGAITMVQNIEGFLIPQIDKNKCIMCEKCKKVCPHILSGGLENGAGTIKGAWIYASSDQKVKMKSSSGAACYELSKKMMEQNGYFSGCIWSHDLTAVHIVGNEIFSLEKTQGSKYVQSVMGDSYKKIGELLKHGERVIFTGTPCQATALHNYINLIDGGKYRFNLLNVALICHGVASPWVWEQYKKWASEKQRSPLKNVNFRDKSKEGYKKSYCCYEYENGTMEYLPTFLPSSKYVEATLVYNLAMRNSCFQCECKGINTGIDIVVGDWYAENKGDGKLGTSCIVAFTMEGKAYVENNLEGLKKFDYRKILEKNSLIKDSVAKPVNRGKFFENIADYHYWSKVEELYPAKYKYKKILVKVGLYDWLKKFIG